MAQPGAPLSPRASPLPPSPAPALAGACQAARSLLCGAGAETHHPVAMTDADSRTFFGTLVGDGRPLIVFTALTLVFAGIGAIFLSVTGHFLPHDVEFLGMQPSDLCQLNE